MADQGIEEVSFKPTDGGWIFRLHNPLWFGTSSYFLVSDAQKAAIVERRRSNRFWRVVSVTSFMLVASIIGSSFPIPKLSPWLGALLGGFGVYTFLVLVSFVERHRLKPLISGLPRAAARITFAETFQSNARNISLPVLLVAFGAFAASLTLGVVLFVERYDVIDSGFGFPLPSAVFLVLGTPAFYWGAILFAKLRIRSNDK